MIITTYTKGSKKNEETRKYGNKSADNKSHVTGNGVIKLQKIVRDKERIGE